MSGTQDFDQLEAFVAPLTAFHRPWFIGGGWAIDLFLDEVTRAHEDVDVIIFRDDQHALFDALPGWILEKIVPHPEPKPEPGTKQAWVGETLVLPVHQVLARPDHGSSPLEFVLNEREGDLWVYRRRPEVTMRVDSIGARRGRIPFLTPEIVLLYKAKHRRDRDEADFTRSRDVLSQGQRDWLRNALTTCHPGHAWISRLG
jgi:hypothetical protein